MNTKTLGMTTTVITKQFIALTVPLVCLALTACQPSLEERMEIARRYGRQKNYAEAIGRLDHIIQDYPNYVPAYTHKSGYLMVQGKLDKAIAIVDMAIKIDSGCFECFKSRGAMKHGPDAIADFDKAIKLNDNDWRIFLYRAWEKTDLKDYAGAISDFDIALKLCGDKSEIATIHNHRGSALLHLNRFEDAKRDIEQAIKLDSTDASFHFTMFMYYFNTGASKQLAERELEKCINLGLDPSIVQRSKATLQMWPSGAETEGNRKGRTRP